MNERIRELAKKVDPELAKETIYCTSKDLEKFAELIVRECAEHIRNRAMRAGGACTIVGEESLWLAKDLEEHFGVEE